MLRYCVENESKNTLNYLSFYRYIVMFLIKSQHNIFMNYIQKEQHLLGIGDIHFLAVLLDGLCGALLAREGVVVGVNDEHIVLLLLAQRPLDRNGAVGTALRQLGKQQIFKRYIRFYEEIYGYSLSQMKYMNLNQIKYYFFVIVTMQCHSIFIIILLHRFYSLRK